MKLILALFCAAFAQSAAAAYSYTYTNTFPTTVTYYSMGSFSGDTEVRQGTISFSALLDEKALPNTTYEYTDVIATAWNGLGIYSRNYITSLFPLQSITFQTDSNAMISDWQFTVAGGHFTMGSTNGFDAASYWINTAYEETGETSINGTWMEQQVTYEKKYYQGYWEGEYTVTPVSSVSLVPEPETYAMFLAGLGLIGFISKKTQS